MSIQSEIMRISGNVTDALAEIAEKGVTVPTGSTSDALASLIADIETGGDVAPFTSVVCGTFTGSGKSIVIDGISSCKLFALRALNKGAYFYENVYVTTLVFDNTNTWAGRVCSMSYFLCQAETLYYCGTSPLSLSDDTLDATSIYKSGNIYFVGDYEYIMAT